jgi:hypothetical protein
MGESGTNPDIMLQTSAPHCPINTAARALTSQRSFSRGLFQFLEVDTSQAPTIGPKRFDVLVCTRGLVRMQNGDRLPSLHSIRTPGTRGEPATY